MIEGEAQLRKRLDAIGGPAGIKRALQLLQLRTVQEAHKNLAPYKRTGTLYRQTVPGQIVGTTAMVVARTSYAMFVERGTGIYGPSHHPIVPRQAKVLAWRTGAVRLSGSSKTRGGKELAGWAFARSVKGRKATPFLVPGAKTAIENSGMGDLIVSEWNGAA
jgi:hypothetical protein